MTAGKPLNYTTAIDPGRTASECMTILGAAGAASAALHYSPEGEPEGLSFRLRTPHGTRDYSLPVNVDGMHQVLRKASRSRELPARIPRATLESRGHAARVAWRVLKDWLEANLALVRAGMASLDAVMLPYLHVDGERTLYQAYAERERAALPPGEGESPSSPARRSDG